MVYTVDWAACRKKEQEDIALQLWAEARRLEELGNNATAGIGKADQSEEWHRADARRSAWFGGVTALENAAWKVLGRSGESVDAQFFEKRAAKPEPTTQAG